MTFINARILRKRPNLFVTPKRNYGNLLIKYESGQNSPADSGRQLTSIHPEPTFTTSWTKSGLTISADLSAITDAHNSFYTYLCRDDGTRWRHTNSQKGKRRLHSNLPRRIMVHSAIN